MLLKFHKVVLYGILVGMKLARLEKNQGFNWGGDWKKSIDRPHFEMSFGNSTKSLSQKPLENGYKKLR
ncbi:M15 family metallopeptidase [Myroides sp. TSA_177.3]|uniref:M15 family metallopeptidase n=1 Tax=Myroides sp. TSA_177.3 TaxID=3415650 RepID=UPI0040457D23